jgi:predicted Zn-dependent protease with MMP-like domain
MYSVSRQEFEDIIDSAIANLPKINIEHLDNVAFIVEDEPSPDQRQTLALRCDQLLFGLYQGVPLSMWHGATKLLPDKITIFKSPLELASNNLEDLRDQVGRTVWHEVAHYYGLDHDRIHELEARERNTKRRH